jgi:predicted transglutaminase-like cysteine proteinase
MVLAASFTAPAMAQSVESAQSAARRLVKAPRGFADSCKRYQWLCESQTASASPLDDAALDVAKKINSRVNFWASEISDSENYGAAEYWALPTNGNGDCEDFVLQKYKLLLDVGVESRNLSIAVVLDWRGDNHAVLVLRHRSGDLVLDSLSSRIKPWNLTGYTFLAMQRQQRPRSALTGRIQIRSAATRESFSILHSHLGNAPETDLQERP